MIVRGKRGGGDLAGAAVVVFIFIFASVRWWGRPCRWMGNQKLPFLGERPGARQGGEQRGSGLF